MTIYCLHSLTTLLLKPVRECKRTHTNMLTHHVFSGLSPTSFCRKLTLPFSLCYPARPLFSSWLPSSTSSHRSSESLTPVYFFFPSAISYSTISPIFFLSLFLYTCFIIHLLFLWSSTAPPHWAAGQCGSEAGCNYFTPPLTARVK